MVLVLLEDSLRSLSVRYSISRMTLHLYENVFVVFLALNAIQDCLLLGLLTSFMKKFKFKMAPADNILRIK